MNASKELFRRAQKVMPGGVNSPVRAFLAVGGDPRFIHSADGAYITDVDGNRYLDYVGSWGPMILGHNHPLIREAVLEAAQSGLSFGAATRREVEMAELMVSLVPNLEMVRMVNSGTEAVMSAVRAARGFTKRDKIIKFEGCYHGHADSMLVRAGSGALTGGTPDSHGVTAGTAKDTLIAKYNDLQGVAEFFERNSGDIAALIVEPIAANMGVVPPAPGFLEGLRNLCDESGAVLIFDEVITGFRLAPGGAQEYFGVRADLVAFGKIIGGGLPVGAYGGQREIMENIAPLGKVYQAGTLSGNPVAMAAGIATLTFLQMNPDVYTRTAALAERLAEGLRGATGNTVNQVGSLACMFMTTSKVTSYETATSCDTFAYAAYFRHMLSSGVYLAPAQYEAMFISAAHTEADIDRTIELAKKWKGGS